MKKLVLGNLVVLGLLFASCSNAQNQSEPAAAESATQSQPATSVINKDIDVAEFANLANAGKGLLLDVRTPGEYGEGHLQGSTLLDFNSASFRDEIAKLDRNQPVYLYCRSGARSGRAADIMTDMGFKEVYNLEGGIMAWQRSGKPVVQ
jgi:rhodanese-related sulfurtransferase